MDSKNLSPFQPLSCPEAFAVQGLRPTKTELMHGVKSYLSFFEKQKVKSQVGCGQVTFE